MASLRSCLSYALLRNVGRGRIDTIRIRSSNVTLMLNRGHHAIPKKCPINILRQASPALPGIRPTSNPQITFLYGVRGYSTPADDGVVKSVDVPQPSQIPPQEVSVVKNVDAAGSSPRTILDESMLPPAPTPPDRLTSVEEPTFESLGLGGWTPKGMVEQLLEFFHVSYDIPWWAAIACLTLTIRTLMLPLTISMKRRTTEYQNNLPEFQHLQKKLTEARRRNDFFEVQQCAQELTKFMQEKSTVSLGHFVPMMIQFPLFLSVYTALKEISSTQQLTSFQNGGLFWFTNLSVPDQYYLLPLTTAVTLFATLKFGGSAPVPSSPQLVLRVQAVVQYGVPALVLFFTATCPAGITYYWTVTNFFVLFVTSLLRIDPIRRYFRIPLPVANTYNTGPNSIKAKKKGFVAGIKDVMDNASITRELEDRERLNAELFESSGISPVPRTFKIDPTKFRSAGNAVAAKKK